MTIEYSDQWWTGTDISDIKEYLHALTDGVIEDFAFARCDCSNMSFEIDYEQDEGAVRRICDQCHSSSFICDSSENWSDAGIERFKCVNCAGSTANIVVGFKLRQASLSSIFQGRDVHWIYVGVRCDTCGVLGCVADWKIDYGPSAHLLKQA